MALSEQEQRLLDEMERHLYQNDADVVSTAGRPSGGISTRSVVLAVLAVAVGLGIVVGSLVFKVPVVGVLGFVVMLVGVLSAFRRRPGSDDLAAPEPRSEGPSVGKKPRSSFMGNLEDRWERRNNPED